MAVVPYLLYCFVMDHPEETCKKIFKVPMILAHRENLTTLHSPRFQSLLPCGIKSAPSVGFCFGIISGDRPLNNIQINSRSTHSNLRIFQPQRLRSHIPHNRHQWRCFVPAVCGYIPDALCAHTSTFRPFALALTLRYTGSASVCQASFCEFRSQ